jgi:hypothetical protein
MSSGPTNVDQLVLPAECQAWLNEMGDSEHVARHSVTVDLDWWNDQLAHYRLPGGPVVGVDASGTPVRTGRADIRRSDLFALGSGAANGLDATLRLLWHCLAWGTGTKPRLCQKRMESVAGAPDDAANLLRDAGTAASRDVVDAYRRLYPHDRRYAIKYLGAAFFTKYLYFAGAGSADHPALILDDRVANALHHRCGWKSLRTGGFWPAWTYGRYSRLLTRWAAKQTDELGRAVRPDEIELWLFKNGVPPSRGALIETAVFVPDLSGTRSGMSGGWAR